MKWIFRIACGLLILTLLIISFQPLRTQWLVSRYGPQIAFNSTVWLSDDPISSASSSLRQQMIRDLVLKVLPGKSKQDIETFLGKSPTHQEMRRLTPQDLQVRVKDEQGNWKPFPRTGEGYYFDELDWDLLYPIGKEQVVLFDHKGNVGSPVTEYLIIRVDSIGRFESWYIVGSQSWPKIVGKEGMATFRKKRSK